MKKNIFIVLLLISILGLQTACTQKKKKSLGIITAFSSPDSPYGKITKEVIAQFKKEKRSLDTCYKKNTTSKNNPHKKFVINLDTQNGKISDVEIVDKESDLKDPAIKKCFLTKIEKWKFTPFKIETRNKISYPSLTLLTRGEVVGLSDAIPRKVENKKNKKKTKNQ